MTISFGENPPRTIEQYFISLFDYFRLSYAKSMEILMSTFVYLCFICDVAAERESYAIMWW